MALDKLLENEAQAEIERIRSEARDRAAQIVMEAKERAQSLIDSRSHALATQRQAMLVQARSAADLELSAARLKASEECLDNVYSQVEQAVQNVTKSDQYRDILARLIDEARAILPNIEAIEVNPADSNVARELANSLSLRENPSIIGGVRAVAAGGKSSITNTLPERFKRVKNELAPQVSRLLAE